MSSWTVKKGLRLYDCDRCNKKYFKHQLKRQRGMLLCDICFDVWPPNVPLTMHFRAIRGNSTSTTATTSPTVFPITTAGITALSQSQFFKRDGWKNFYVMCIVGSPGAVTVTGNPAIVVGAQGARLTLIGTDDAKTVTLTSGTGITLSGNKSLKLGSTNTANFVYDTTTGWVEISRT